MDNEYGLDADYFKKKLTLIVRDISQYTPSEMYRELIRLSLTAATQADIKVEVKETIRETE